jgi:DNA-binding CsgD family transcriptional regulator
MTSSAALERGRAAFTEHRWGDAFDALTEADAEVGLPADDLDRLATAALVMGREEVGLDLAVRAHEVYLALPDADGAARSAAWIGLYLMSRGDMARSNGWLARAGRIAHESGGDSASGLLLIPAGLGALYGGDAVTAVGTFAEAFRVGERHGDREAMVLAQLGRGQAKIMLGEIADGLSLLDEAMVAVTAGEVSVVASGIVYCAVIGTCHLAYDVRRAQEWTIALDRWCGARPDMVMFSGQCQGHRAELYCLHGAWSDALVAARAAQALTQRGDWAAAFGAWYYQGEVQRLRGEVDEADVSYRRAGEAGWPPQPGLALLRLAQGKVRDARSLIHEVADAADGVDQATRRQLLPAVVEIELAAGDVVAARMAADELSSVTPADGMPMMRAVALRAEGSVRLEEGDAPGALVPLRKAWAIWQELDAPYEAARCRVLTARAWRALGDEASASMELEAARAVFVELGAVPDLLRVDGLTRGARGTTATSLTPREVEVVRLVAEGKTNRTIAGQLYLSEKTVDRHLSNVFAKLGVSSRAAATAYAYEHALI